MQKLAQYDNFLIFVLQNHIFSKLILLKTPKLLQIQFFLGVKFESKILLRVKELTFSNSAPPSEF